MRAPVLIVAMFLAAACPVLAQQAPDVHTFSAQPAPIPDPPMKYRLLPDAAQQTLGNAAPLYLMAFTMAKVDSKRLEELEDTPAAKLRAAGAEDFLKGQALAQIHVATYRSYCQWGSSYRQQGVDWNAAYLNQARYLSNVLRIKASLEIADKQYDDALATLQDGFTLAANLSHDAPLIQSLIAVANESSQLDVVETLITSRGSPNLYWALANLKRPLIDRRQVMELESGQIFFTFPELRHVEDLSAQGSRQVFLRLMGFFPKGSSLVESTAWMIHVYPEAKVALVKSGLDPAKVEAMPADTVVLAYDVMQFQQVAQQFTRTAGLPYWQAAPLLADAEERLDYLKSPGNPLFDLLPAFPRASVQYARVERQVAMLTCVEGVRAYAATHDGAPPPNLDALSPQTPAPIDPMLGKPFEYEAQDRTFTLRAPAQFNEPVYRITLAQ